MYSSNVIDTGCAQGMAFYGTCLQNVYHQEWWTKISLDSNRRLPEAMSHAKKKWHMDFDAENGCSSIITARLIRTHKEHCVGTIAGGLIKGIPEKD